MNNNKEDMNIKNFNPWIFFCSFPFSGLGL